MTRTDGRLSAGPVAGRLNGKVAVVTGAGGGQGREVALLFARAGAAVVCCDIKKEGLEQTGRLAHAKGLTLDLSIVDATDEPAVRAWIDEGAERHGGIDILYNNGASAHFVPFAEMTVDQWKDTLRLELDVVFIPTKAAWPHMIARGGGSIINIASVAGMRGAEVVEGAGQAAHAAGKGGVIGFTNQIAAEGAPHWIRANTISPGPIVTPASKALLDQVPSFRKVFEGVSLLRRSGQPVDVAYAGLFLASDESAYITGVNLPIDGGTSSKIGLSLAS